MGSTPRTKIRTQNVDLAIISKDHRSELIRCLVEILTLPLTSLPNRWRFCIQRIDMRKEHINSYSNKRITDFLRWAREPDRFRPWQQVLSSRRQRTVIPALRRELLRAGENLRY